VEGERAVDFVVDFENSVAREAARRGMHGVVCGHIHRATMRDVHGVLYCNTGDWVESCTALVERPDGTLELLAVGSEAQPAGPLLLESAGRAG
jgi:UDP-2,3-diacylglucosamine pyrophosphatase LpxH